MKFNITFQLKQNGDKQVLYINGNLIYKIKLKKGIATIHNGSVGLGHSCHPNIANSGSIKGMINMGYWNKRDKIVKTGGYKYNVSVLSISGELDFVCHLIEEGKIEPDFFKHTANTEPQTLTDSINYIKNK